MRILSVNKWRRSQDIHTLGAPRGIMLGHEALVRRGHRIDYIFIDDVCQEGELRFPHLLFPVLVLPKILQLTSRYRYDVVEISSGDGWLYGLLRWFFGKNARPVFVATSAGLEHHAWEEVFRDCDLGLREMNGLWARNLRPWMIQKEVEFAIRTSDHFIPLRSFDAEYVIGRKWKTISRVTVIPRGVGIEYFLEREGVDCVNRLLFVGTWHPRKGIKYLVDAFCILRQKYPSLQLSLIGTRLGDELLRDFPLCVQQGIRVVSVMPPEAVVREYATHDIFILPSSHEGCPKALLEAMAAGMPVVASQNAGGDLIEHKVNGLLVPNRDSQALAAAVELLITDRRLRQRLSKRAQSEAKKYIWEEIAVRYESLYTKLLEEKCESKGESSLYH